MAESNIPSQTPNTVPVQNQHEDHEDHANLEEMHDEEPPWDDEAERGIHHPPMIEQKPVNNPDDQQGPPGT
ncbi:hypothetical protein FRB99_002401 [Tulasnella sp. 403]|nr:hypothetical protein FRB99_002401 [Tulasnella sp. 403]